MWDRDSKLAPAKDGTKDGRGWHFTYEFPRMGLQIYASKGWHHSNNGTKLAVPKDGTAQTMAPNLLLQSMALPKDGTKVAPAKDGPLVVQQQFQTVLQQFHRLKTCAGPPCSNKQHDSSCGACKRSVPKRQQGGEC
eukprot:1141446-Pelagomonas_calceolata.AAC.3